MLSFFNILKLSIFGESHGEAIGMTLEGLPALLQFPPDMARVPAEPNRLSNQVLVQLFEQEWGAVRE